MLVYRIWAESRPAEAFQTAVSNYQTALATSTQYRSFLNGVSDAVDSGKLGATALEALAGVSKNDVEASALLAKLQKDNSIAAILPLRDSIRAIDTRLTENVRLQERSLNQLAADMSASAKRGAVQMGLAIVATLLLAGWFIRS